MLNCWRVPAVTFPITTLWLHVTTVKVLDSLLCQLLLLLLLLLLKCRRHPKVTQLAGDNRDNQMTVKPQGSSLFFLISSCFFLASSFRFLSASRLTRNQIWCLVVSGHSGILSDCHFSIQVRWKMMKVKLLNASSRFCRWNSSSSLQRTREDSRGLQKVLLYFSCTIHFSICLSKNVHLSIYLSISLSLSIYLSIEKWISIYLSMYLSVHLSIYLSKNEYLSIYLSIYLSLSLSLPLCNCLCMCMCMAPRKKK